MDQFWSRVGGAVGGEGGGIHKTFNSDYATFLIAFGNMLSCAAHISADNYGPNDDKK